MSLRPRMRQALPEAMRARDKAAVSALRSTLAALDNAEAVPLDESATPGPAIEQTPTGAGATEAARRELSEHTVAGIVRAEAEERLEAAAHLTSPPTPPTPPASARRRRYCYACWTSRTARQRPADHGTAGWPRPGPAPDKPANRPGAGEHQASRNPRHPTHPAS